MNQIANNSRRSFLKTGASLGTGLIISFMIPAKAGRLKNLLEPHPADAPFSPNAFLSIGTDNKIKVLLAHAEMGQGIWTTLTMLIAEELDADFKDIQVEHAPTDKAYFHTAWGLQLTGGSSTTWSEFDRYRKAGATARVLLVEAAAQKWGIKPTDCSTANGFVTAGNKKLSYGALASVAATLKAPADVALRTKEQWKYIGKGMKRLDAPVKVNGQAKYGMDMQFEGMLTAVVAHSPVMMGKVKSFDATKTRLVKGVVDVVQIPTGVAVIATNYWTAQQGKKALQVLWDLGDNVSVDSATQFDLFKTLATGVNKQVAKAGDAEAAVKNASKIFEATLTFPYLAHAAMEPLNCTVKIDGEKCDIWTGTQMPGGDQEAAAKVLNIKPENISVHTPFLGGAFGRRATPDADFVVEAVHIAKASGRFIKMVWSREDDMQSGHYRPSMMHTIKVGLDNNNMPLSWHHIVTGQALPGDDGAGTAEGISDSPYLAAIPNHYIGTVSPKIDIPVLWLRSVGHTHTAYAMETMIDELAKAAGKDPVEYRRLLLKGKSRNLGVINLVAEKAGWGKPLPAGHFHGIAAHESFRSYCAQVAEISIDENGLVKVHKITCAIDCGLAVNPDGVRAQIESGIIYALSGNLYEKITFKEGKVEQGNFNNYRILRMNEAPEIEVHIVDSTEQMGGVGEPGYPPAAPAVANAVFAATGKRIRSLPFGEVNFKK